MIIEIVSLNHIIVYILFVFDRNTWNHTTVFKQMIIDKVPFKKMHWNIESIVIVIIKHLEMKQTLALNKPLGVDMLLNK